MKRYFLDFKKYKNVFLCFVFFLILIGAEAYANRKITISFGSKTEKNIAYQVFWTSDENQVFTENRKVEAFVGAGFHLLTFELPTYKIKRLRIDFDQNPGKVELSYIKVKGLKTKILDDFNQFLYADISSYQNNGVSLEIISDQMDPQIIYNGKLNIYSGIHLNPIHVLSGFLLFLMIYLCHLKYKFSVWTVLLWTPFLLLYVLKYESLFHTATNLYNYNYSWYFLFNFFSAESLILLLLAVLLMCFFLSKKLRILSILLTMVLMLILLTDYVVIEQLDARFIFSEVRTQGTAFDTIYEMLKQYFVSDVGIINIILFLNLGFIFIYFKQTSKKIALSFFCFSLLLVADMKMVKNAGLFDYMFYNVFDVNFKNHQSVKHSDAEIVKIRQKVNIQQECIKGKNTRKNLILIVVESLSSYKVKSFNGIENKMPKLDKIAQQGVSYTHYYSNSDNTLSGLFPILTGEPMIHDYRSLGNFEFEPYYAQSLPKRLAKKGYKTKYFQAAKMMEGKDSLVYNSGFTDVSFSEDKFYENKERFIFNGVSDDVLFDNVLQNYKKEDKSKPFAYVILTLTTHGPYIDPVTKVYSFDKTLAFTDNQLDKFITKLKQTDFFDNGIVVITGDHRAMVSMKPSEYQNFGVLAVAAVPLIILEKNEVARQEGELFSHTDLAPSLEYYLTDEGCFNSFQKNIFDTSFHKDVCMIYSYLSPQDKVRVYCSENKYSDITLNGDNTTIDDESLMAYKDYVLYLRTQPMMP